MMTNDSNQKKWVVRSVMAFTIAGLLIAPTVLGELSGSGTVGDIVQLSTSVASISALGSTASSGSASGSPVASSGYFEVTNSGSNVDTFIRYDWGTTPYYGSNTGNTQITIRSTTYKISDLLWLKQETVNSAGTPTTSAYYSPLLIKSSVTATSTFTSAGADCTTNGWTNLPSSGFSGEAAGTITFKYYTGTGSNDAPTTSEAFNYCVDNTNDQVIISKTKDASAGTRVYLYSSASSGALLTYQYEFKDTGQTNGNKYCLVSVAGTGTGSTPDLAQCSKLPYELAGSTKARLYVLWDPPAYFPAQNQGGVVTYGVAGTQWDPYAPSTTQTA